jgi:hypothetical protein
MTKVAILSLVIAGPSTTWLTVTKRDTESAGLLENMQKMSIALGQEQKSRKIGKKSKHVENEGGNSCPCLLPAIL